ncbi:MAG: hypothetical protein A3J38_00140 [Gammaproteobacteria bacterium RIFCSPHIGHO2_12_FULL_45_9]|nr:MAG: hypothetical protein A3J38_00140 [Gammaproteobacteria bacterium RIFCSPHIGHO2_12_FULL_45_9]
MDESNIIYEQYFALLVQAMQTMPPAWVLTQLFQTKDWMLPPAREAHTVFDYLIAENAAEDNLLFYACTAPAKDMHLIQWLVWSGVHITGLLQTHIMQLEYPEHIRYFLQTYQPEHSSRTHDLMQHIQRLHRYTEYCIQSDYWFAVMAIQKGYPEWLTFFLSKHRKIPVAPGREHSLLYQAIDANRCDMVSLLLSYNASLDRESLAYVNTHLQGTEIEARIQETLLEYAEQAASVRVSPTMACLFTLTEESDKESLIDEDELIGLPIN